jgi:UDP-3-O-[3-hydroxymyristoyl] glucosamine N-acyltransferase
VEIAGVSTLESASEHQIAFAEDPRQSSAVAASRAVAVLVPEDFPDVPGPLLIRVGKPRQAFFAIAERFTPAPETQGVHGDASIDPAARLGADVAVGACAVISAGVSVGARSRIGAGAYLGPGVQIGVDCLIGANVSILRDCRIGDRCIIHPGAVIGGDGFGFFWDGTRHTKVPHLGIVVVEDDVEIGCNACIDRATLSVTRVGRGTKMDNLVQVAHNCDIGEHAILVSQAGIAGSTKIGSRAMLGGQVAVADHLQIGAGARVASTSGVAKDLEPGASVLGAPARPIKQFWREQAALTKLPELLKQVRSLQNELESLQARLAELEGG